MTINESKRYIEEVLHCVINEKSFSIIDEEACTWVAEVTTVRSQVPLSYLVIVEGVTRFVIEKRWSRDLADWFESVS